MAPTLFADALPLEVGDGLRLEVRSHDTLEAAHALVARNQDRLRRWENWALAEQCLAGSRAFTDLMLAQYAQGRNLPALIMLHDEPVGSISLRIDPDNLVGEIGYWIDGEHEGQGLVTRSSAALRDLAFARGLQRVELRAAVENTRSRAVAERLGFRYEGILRSAIPLGATRLDLALYAQLPTDR